MTPSFSFTLALKPPAFAAFSSSASGLTDPQRRRHLGSPAVNDRTPTAAEPRVQGGALLATVGERGVPCVRGGRVRMTPCGD